MLEGALPTKCWRCESSWSTWRSYLLSHHIGETDRKLHIGLFWPIQNTDHDDYLLQLSFKGWVWLSFGLELDIFLGHLFLFDSHLLIDRGATITSSPSGWSSNKGMQWCSSSPSKSLKAFRAVSGSLSTASQHLSLVTRWLASFLRGISGRLEVPRYVRSQISYKKEMKKQRMPLQKS